MKYAPSLSLIGILIGIPCLFGAAFAGSGNAIEVHEGTSPQKSNAKVDSAYRSATQALQGILDNMDQEEAERTQRDLREAAERDRQAMIQQADEDRKNRESLRRASQDKSLDPWANNKAGQPSGQKAPQSQPTKTSQQALDPNANYDGEPCKYFTKHNDAAHLYYHQEGSMVSYGDRVYQCTGGRWRFKVFVQNYWANPQAIAAERTEN
ncbi:hypothetical protein [Achromobacter aloeverae]|uniref:Uncharacterized protein n=1 Tax=Achromobacter aloeverae TaxID=1750518 RepID=A0A4Q1HD39_9BURK|nr:hypothetical protein [Achromobacter aloeverae]RXN83735.1 hypothetical protein C7R54_26030 [Achromobacter aloeverae]